MESPPTGTVTFLFTDIEGSTTLAHAHREQWESLLGRHQDIVVGAIRAHKGRVFQVVGDAFCTAFSTAADALAAAVEAQRLLLKEPWHPAPVKVRMGLHTGDADSDGDSYRGHVTLSLVQRLMSAGHGGQILISDTTENLVRGRLPEGISMLDLGEHEFKDALRSVRIFQVQGTGLPRHLPPLRAVEFHPNNLHPQPTSFIGREKELAEIKRLLSEARILTLVGPGGTGKSRLSTQVAADVVTQYRAGVWLVELAPILDPLLVPRTIAHAMGLRDEPQRPMVDMLCDHLRDKSMLLILDNCEHLVDACASLAGQLLRAAPNLRILATSRETLGAAGEAIYRVPSMGLPDPGLPPSPELPMQCEAARLFIERATAANPEFRVGTDNIPTLVQVCHRLDGIPLAIELAAAKVRVLSIEQIAERLDDRFRLLTGGSRTALERHQTLRATLDWSYDLLTPAEQRLLRRLATFVGGWTLDAAEAVCGLPAEGSPSPGEEVVAVLENLINKSLVLAESSAGPFRYRMLETTRQYALEKLVASGESEALRDAHLHYFLQLATDADAHLRASGQIGWLSRLEAENENLRLALAWGLDRTSAEPVLRLVAALGRFWLLRAYWTEGARWQDRALAKPWNAASTAEKKARAQVLCLRAAIAGSLDQLRVADDMARAALALFDDVGERWGAACARELVAANMLREGTPGSEPLVEQALAEFRELGDPWGEALALRDTARLLRGEGARAERQRTLETALACARKSGDRALVLEILWRQGLQAAEVEDWRNLQAIPRAIFALASELGIPSHRWARFIECELLIAHGEKQAAREKLLELADSFRAVGDRNMQGVLLMYLAALSESEGRLEEALQHANRSIELQREIGSQVAVAWRLALLGFLENRLGMNEAAIRHHRESIEILQTEIAAGVAPWAAAVYFVASLFVPADAATAAKLLGFDEHLLRTFGFARRSFPRGMYVDRFTATLHEHLTTEELQAAWDAGEQMSIEDGLSFALEAVKSLR